MREATNDASRLILESHDPNGENRRMYAWLATFQEKTDEVVHVQAHSEQAHRLVRVNQYLPASHLPRRMRLLRR